LKEAISIDLIKIPDRVFYGRHSEIAWGIVSPVAVAKLDRRQLYVIFFASVFGNLTNEI
jgi:hypothetical protein